MNQQQFDQAAYLRRIKYDGETEPTVDTLKALHHAQLYTIPFESFDVQLDRDINLNTEAIFEKLIHKRRGGYCFELNGIFLMALKSILNNTLKKQAAGKEQVQELFEGQAYLDALKNHFGIELDGPYENLRPLPSSYQ